MTYTGNRLLNLNNLRSLIILAAFIFGAGFPGIENDLVLWLIFPFIYIITTFAAFYFELNESEFLVKNYMIPFLKIKYSLPEISQIQIEDAGYRSVAKARLKIVRQEPVLWGYSASSLGINEWQSLVNGLTFKKIPVVISSDNLKRSIGIPEN